MKYPDYEKLISYVKDRFREDKVAELNGLEVVIDYCTDFPPDYLDDTDSDFFREEIERIVHDLYGEIESTIKKKESGLLRIENGKFLLIHKDDGYKQEDNETILFKNLEPHEISLINSSAFDLDEKSRQSLEVIYKQKVTKFGNDDEKFKAARLIVDSYSISSISNSKHIEFFDTAGAIGTKLKVEKSYTYYEYIAKYYRNQYEHERSAFFFGKALESATECEESTEILVSLTRSARIQYDLCGDEVEAAKLFIHENELKIASVIGFEKLALKTLRFISDYCQNPLKVFYWAVGLIILFSVFYTIFGISPSGKSEQSLFTSCSYGFIEFLDALYFSVVTFTTLGYGDYTPSNIITRFLASLQALSGLFFTSLFLVALVRKYGRK